MNRKIAFPLLLVSVLLLTWSCASPNTDNAAPAAEPPAPAAAPAEPVATAPDPAPAPAPEVKEAKNEAKKNEAPAAKNDTPKETTLSSGMKIVELVVGKGEEAKPGDRAQVHYTGWLYENGKRGAKFDSSVDRGMPFELPVGLPGVIRGWIEGIPGMRVGGKRELIIPPDMGYGARGAGGVIPPNATLDFEIELLALAK